ncbi:MAG TPA: lipopolysaccharide heptosyltransferase II [Gemmatimonadales bacterium]|nr:lipopolysaccharide heptosyltransferase II [Gemmatimonadales bacterium]
MPHLPVSPNILAVRFSSIGDILLTTPLLRAIQHSYPDARVTLLTKREYVPLLSHNPRVHRVLGLAPERSLFSLATELRGDRYTHLLDLHDNLRSRALRLLVPGRWRSYPKHRFARTLLIRLKRNRYRDRRPVAERYFSAARDLAVKPDGLPPEFFIGREAAEHVSAWLRSVGLENEPNIVAMAPGAAHATKRWPLEHWRTLIDRHVQDGTAVVLVGGRADAPLGTELAQNGRGRVANATGIFGLQTTGALLQRSRALISGDTGVMHMATGVGTPVVGLFGPTVEAFGFFPYSRKARVVELPLACRPCTSQGGPRCPLVHHRCMIDIQPAAVYQTLQSTFT